MAPPHLVLLNGVAKETRAPFGGAPDIEAGHARRRPGGGPAGGRPRGTSTRVCGGRAAPSGAHQKSCRPLRARACLSLLRTPGDARRRVLERLRCGPAAPGRALLYSLSQPLASLGRSGRAGGAGGRRGPWDSLPHVGSQPSSRPGRVAESVRGRREGFTPW